MKILVDNYIKQLAAEGRYSSNTCKSYHRDLSFWLVFCQQNNIKNWQKLVNEDINLAVMNMRQKQLSASTIKRRLSALRVFLGFLLAQGIIAINVAKKIKTPKINRKLPNIISYDKVKQLLSNTSNDFTVSRNNAIIAILYNSALRLSELVAIDIIDVDIHSGFIKVLGKGSVERYTPIGDKALLIIAKYLKLRTIFDNKALFVNKKNHRLSVRMVQYIVQKQALANGVNQHIYPHMLRHSAATHFLQSSHDLASVQKFLGHKSIKSTQCYTHLDYLELAKTYDKCHPRAKK